MQAGRIASGGTGAKPRMSKWWQGVLLGGGVLLIAAGLGLVVNSGGSASGEGNAAFSLEPASKNVSLNSDVFSVDVKASNVNNLGAFDFTLTFDTSVLEYVSITDRHFLTSTGRTQSCLSPEADPRDPAHDVVANVNHNGALHFGCTTFGLVTGNGGTPGPGGDGVLATVSFRPKGRGQRGISFVGLDPDPPYPVRPPGPDIGYDNGDGTQTFLPDTGEFGRTGLANIEGASIDASASGASINVFDPSVDPEPTGVPATPTAVAHNGPPSDVQKTVQAVLGTPERTLPGSSGATGTTGGDAGVPQGRPVYDPVTGQQTGVIADDGTFIPIDRSRLSSSGGSGTGSSGRAGSATGGARGPNGAPIAGYGPEHHEHPWPARAGAALLILGVIATAGGAAARRREA
jgi:hypothetical protein